MEPYIGEIRTFAFNKIPVGFLPCDGRTLQITAYSALYALLGSVFGGDGKATFCIPDLRGRFMIDQGVAKSTTTYQVGQKNGSEAVVLTAGAYPSHTHPAYVANTGAGNTYFTGKNGAGLMICQEPAVTVITNENVYAYAVQTDTTKLVQLAPGTIGTSGAAVGHENRMPYMALTVCIAVVGNWPPRN